MSCSVCKRDDIGAINASLRAGGPTGTVRAVADRHSVGRAMLGEHRTKCLRLEGRVAKDGPDPRPEPPVPRARKPASEPPPTPDDSPDSAGQDRTSAQLFGTDMPRARGPTDLISAKTFEERSVCCADIIAAGQWEGRPTVGWLMSLWQVEAITVRGYHRAGRVRCALDRGDTAALLEDTLASLRRQERDAAEQATALETLAEDYEMMRADEDPETVEARSNAAVKLRSTAVKYRDIALKARSKFADVAGLVKLSLTVSIEQDPRVAAFVDYLLDAVDALGDEISRALAEHAAQNGGIVPALPDPRAFVEGKVSEYTADEKKKELAA